MAAIARIKLSAGRLAIRRDGGRMQADYRDDAVNTSRTAWAEIAEMRAFALHLLALCGDGEIPTATYGSLRVKQIAARRRA